MLLRLLTLLAGCLLAAGCRLITRHYPCSSLRHQKSWVYLDRMALGAGQAEVSFGVRLTTETQPAPHRYSLVLRVIPEHLWEPELEGRCKTIIHALNNQIHNPDIVEIPLSLSLQHSLANRSAIGFELEQPRVYYFVVEDCRKTLVNQYFNRKSTLDLEVDIRSNGSNCGEDEHIYNWVLPLWLAIDALLLLLLRRGRRLQQHDETNWASIITSVVAWLQLISLGLIYVDHLVYSLGSGNHYSFFHFLYMIASSISKVVALTLLAFLAYGWMTAFKIGDAEEIYFAVATLMGVICLVLALLSKVSDGSPTKTHIYDSAAFYFEFAVQAAGFVVFALGIVRSSIKLAKEPGFRNYLFGLGLLGALGFLWQPCVVLYAEDADRHRRQVWVFLWVETARLLQVAVLAWQVVHRKSVFNQLNLKNKSFMMTNQKYL